MVFYERLSPQDVSFLYAESPTAQMHVGALTLLEAPEFSYEDLCDMIDAKLAVAPRLRRKLMWVPYGQGRPVWVDDAHFDIRYHVRHSGLPHPGGRRELLAHFGRVMSIALDRQRPLWEVWLVDQPGGDKAIIYKVHHAMVDGISGVDLALVLFDLTPDAGPPETAPFEAGPAPTKQRLLVDSVVERLTQPAEMVRSVRAAARAPRDAVAETRRRLGGLLRLGGSMQAAQENSLWRDIGGHRRFETVSLPLAEVKAIKSHHGVTVNDVVLAMVSGGLRHYMVERGDVVDDVGMNVMVPVSVRSEQDRGTYGNQVSMMLVTLPVGEPDPEAALASIHTQTETLKESHQAEGADSLMRSFDYLPMFFLNLAARGAAAQRFINLVVTNVPGPQFPLYCLGARMREAYPYVGLLGKISVAVAVLSYDGQLNFGLSGDWDTTADLAVFAEGIEKALGNLR
ncbi:MAG: wax ester/triacylglycerol synthase family O-acyltransferase [Acidimicrobiia bacterium]